jgi:folate-binding protein YgfZ
MAGRSAHLKWRGVVQASGPDAGRLLDGLVTNDLSDLDRSPAIHAGLLSPQGKILFAFFILRSGGGYLIDVAADQAAGLVKRLNFYKLRTAAQFTDLSAEMAVVAGWDGPPPDLPRGILAVPDPRHPDLGCRIVLPAARLPELGAFADDVEAYQARRIELGVPEEGRDYPLGETFPHEADFDLFNGVSFTKGCFVGQEVVSRMQNKTVVRKRVVRISGSGLVTGAEIKHGEGVIGMVGSVAGNAALAMVRLDRAVEAASKGESLLSNGAPIVVDAAALARYRDSVANKPVIDL